MFVKLKRSKIFQGDPLYLNVSEIVSVTPARGRDDNQPLGFWWVMTSARSEVGAPIQYGIDDAEVKPLLTYLDFLNDRLVDTPRQWPEHEEDRS